jgi:protein-tyrosine-phosphatase
MAEAVLRAQAPTWQHDSAGTNGLHDGELADERTREVLLRHGLATTHRSRQVQAQDFTRFDLILAMDRRNVRDLAAMRPAQATARVRLLGSWDPQGESEVPDPYYDGLDAFEAVYAQVLRCCRAVVADPNRT